MGIEGVAKGNNVNFPLLVLYHFLEIVIEIFPSTYLISLNKRYMDQYKILFVLKDAS